GGCVSLLAADIGTPHARTTARGGLLMIEDTTVRGAVRDAVREAARGAYRQGVQRVAPLIRRMGEL
ncbi:hypothetical protein ACWD67_35380, partial [Streptomyces sp. 900116325]